MAGCAAGSCRKKPWPPSNISRRAPGMPRARNSLLAGGAIPSKRPPHTRVGQVMAPRRSAVSCSARAASWLVSPWLGVAALPLEAHALADQSPPCRGWPRARPRPSGCRGAPSAVPTARRGSGRPARAAGRRRRPHRRPRCRPGPAGAPARGAGWPAPGPPCRRRRSPMTRQSSQPTASSSAAASSAKSAMA